MEKLYYHKDRYRADDSLAIMAYCDGEYGREPYGMVTVCLKEYGMTPEEGTVYLPTYNMFGSFLPTVMEDLVEEILGVVQIGYGTGLHVRLKKDWEKNVETF